MPIKPLAAAFYILSEVKNMCFFTAHPSIPIITRLDVCNLDSAAEHDFIETVTLINTEISQSVGC